MDPRIRDILITLAFMLVWTFSSPPLMLGIMVRGLVIVMCFAGLYALFGAREKRSSMWTEKTRNIWFVMVIANFAAVSGNIEFILRQVPPSNAVFPVMLFAIYSVKGCRGAAFYKPGYEMNK